jgi:hypothetical protein
VRLPPRITLKEARDLLYRAVVLRAYKDANYNRAAAARVLGMSYKGFLNPSTKPKARRNPPCRQPSGRSMRSALREHGKSELRKPRSGEQVRVPFAFDSAPPLRVLGREGVILECEPIAPPAALGSRPRRGRPAPAQSPGYRPDSSPGGPAKVPSAGPPAASAERGPRNSGSPPSPRI